MEASTTYLRIVFLSMIPSMLYNVGSGVLRAVGDSRRPLYFLAVCCIVNILLDLVFVVALKMGVAGVAIATTCAQCVSAALVCICLGRADGSYRLEIKKMRADRNLLGRTIRIGLPSGLQSVMYSLSNLIITSTVNGFGTDTVAAWVAMGKVDALWWMISNAFGISIMTFVGQNYGAKQYDRVRRGLLVCSGLAFCAAGIFSTFYMLAAKYLFRLFTSEEQVLSIALNMLPYIAPWYFLFVPIEIISGAFRGLGDTLRPALITAVGICALRVCWMLLIVPNWHQMVVIVVSYPVSWILTSIAFMIYYFKTRRTMIPAR